MIGDGVGVGSGVGDVGIGCGVGRGVGVAIGVGSATGTGGTAYSAVLATTTVALTMIPTRPNWRSLSTPVLDDPRRPRHEAADQQDR